ncbi:hypothetical protein Tco_0896722 [Tanacetum coccineum]
MAAAGPSNILARRVTDDLIDFSEDTLMCLRDDIRDENTKLMGLNDVIAQAEDKKSTKEAHVKIMQADSSYPVSVAKQVGNHPEYANSIHLVQDKLSLNRKGKGKASMKDTKQKVTGIKEVDDLKEEQPKPLYVPIKTEEEEPLPLDIVYPHSHFALSTWGSNTKGKAHYGLRSLGPLKEEIVHVKKPYSMMKVINVVLGLRAQKTGVGCSDEFPDEMDMEKDEVVFKIHTKGHFEYDPLRLININGHYSINGSIDLYVAYNKQNLGKYYYKNMEWEEDDAGLRCCSSTPFDTIYKRNISKSKKIGVIHDEVAGRKRKKSLVNGGNKGKEKVFKDEGNQGVVTIYKRAMVNRKAKMVEVKGVVKTGRDRGVVIGGKEEVVKVESE